LYTAILTMILIIIIILISTILRNEKGTDLLPAVLADHCPKGWLAHQRKCYYFSVNEGNWISGSSHCSSHNASLAMVDSQEELDFFLRYKSPPDHWIGLQKDSGQPWRWINGSIFTGQIIEFKAPLPDDHPTSLKKPPSNYFNKKLKKCFYCPFSICEILKPLEQLFSKCAPWSPWVSAKPIGSSADPSSSSLHLQAFSPLSCSSPSHCLLCHQMSFFLTFLIVQILSPSSSLLSKPYFPPTTQKVL
uniref:C-type lectin domain-containing protein n=1 Tax=Anolis carolinensis TaxID=28377 RepID=A0A803TAQ3_ANOCA